MRHRNRSAAASEKPATLFDRFAVAFGTGMLALIIGSMFWLGVGMYVRNMVEHVPFAYVLYFSGAMAALGFLLCENVIVDLFVALLEVMLGDRRR